MDIHEIVKFVFVASNSLQGIINYSVDSSLCLVIRAPSIITLKPLSKHWVWEWCVSPECLMDQSAEQAAIIHSVNDALHQSITRVISIITLKPIVDQSVEQAFIIL